ncbi:hypothetical protein [Kitasatospora sp. GAS204B]|uniref:hypothetical protein n=1 Tax=unclassified Kitasatospora TaxID=2633591 RepID=UPI0024743B5C|nr:hypothetical protein [Kitasatospora sp. GAS204B]MDH6116621.1 hypothetical protein [Kitasatospora sp. GAS204B]
MDPYRRVDKVARLSEWKSGNYCQFIDKIGKDIVSDITTCVIRGMLTTYTQSTAAMYGIPLVDDVYCGLAWDSKRRNWDASATRLPIADGKPLLLVPKVIVRHDLLLTKQELLGFSPRYAGPVEIEASRNADQLIGLLLDFSDEGWRCFADHVFLTGEVLPGPRHAPSTR